MTNKKKKQMYWGIKSTYMAQHLICDCHWLATYMFLEYHPLS